MVVLDNLARRALLLKLLRTSLYAGAAYELLLAVTLMTLPGHLFSSLSVPPPGEQFYLWLLAILLATAGVLCLLPAYDPRRYSGIVAVAIAGRLLAGLALLAAAVGQPALAGLYPLCGVEFAFGLTYALSWLPLRL